MFNPSDEPFRNQKVNPALARAERAAFSAALKLFRSPRHFLQCPRVAIGVAEGSVLHALLVFVKLAHFNAPADERFASLVDAPWISCTSPMFPIKCAFIRLIRLRLFASYFSSSDFRKAVCFFSARKQPPLIYSNCGGCLARGSLGQSH